MDHGIELQHADSEVHFIIHSRTYLQLTTVNSACRVVDESKISFDYQPEQNPHFPQNFNRVITPEDIGVKMVHCRSQSHF